jgi:GNAT superfamily N-acetyltransferase
MYSIYELDAASKARFASFQRKYGGHQFERIGVDASIIALGAFFLDTAVGFAIATAENGHCIVNEIRVLPQYCNIGIGTELLKRIGQAAAKRNCSKMLLYFLKDEKSSPVIERLLEKCNFNTPTSDLFHYTYQCEDLLRLKWINRESLKKLSHKGNILPDRYRIFPLLDLTDEEEAYLLKERDISYPAILCPIDKTGGADRRLSLGVRDGKRLIGWVAVERILRDALLFKCAYLDPGYRGGFISINMLSLVLHNQFQEGIRYSVAGVLKSNPRMIKLMSHMLEDSYITRYDRFVAAFIRRWHSFMASSKTFKVLSISSSVCVKQGNNCHPIKTPRFIHSCMKMDLHSVS